MARDGPHMYLEINSECEGYFMADLDFMLCVYDIPDCIIKCAMEVLTCPDLYQMLWNCRQELREPLQDIMV